MADVTNSFEKLERALKKLNIQLIDDFEEIKRGSPAPTIQLIRKLLFNTSTVVMKYMLLRGCASHVTDKKVVIATFDLMRETVKYSPAMTIDQFFSNGFAMHKLHLLARLADYVGETDRSVARSPQKVSFVVPSQVLSQGNLASSMSDNIWSMSDVIKATLLDTPGKGKQGSNKPTNISTLQSNSNDNVAENYNETTPVDDAQETTNVTKDVAATSPKRSMSPPVNSTRSSAAAATSTIHHTPTLSSSRGNSRSSPSRGSKEWETKVDAIVQQRIAAAIKDVSAKYDAVLNKLVAAVDAEFTLLNNRIKRLESIAGIEDEQAIHNNATSTMKSSSEDEKY